MSRGLSTSATAGVTCRSSADTLNPLTLMSGTATVHAGAAPGADAPVLVSGAAALPVLAPAPDAGLAAAPPELAVPPACADALPGALVNSSKFNCPCGPNHALTSPPDKLTFSISTARLAK